jgi:hypothetical protein
MMPGMPERRSHDYARHGVTSLFAAFNIADGTVISQTHRQHRAVEFKKFLIAIDKAVPAELDVHLVCDNLATHKTPPSGTGWPNIHASTCTSLPLADGELGDRDAAGCRVRKDDPEYGLRRRLLRRP